MIPLAWAETGKTHTVCRLGGGEKLRKHMEHLGITPGEAITVLSVLGGGVIVSVRDTRLALSEEMARRILVQGENEHENFAGCGRGQERRGAAASWDGRSETEDDGHGHHPGHGDLRAEDRPAGRPDGAHRKGL